MGQSPSSSLASEEGHAGREQPPEAPAASQQRLFDPFEARQRDNFPAPSFEHLLRPPDPAEDAGADDDRSEAPSIDTLAAMYPVDFPLR